MCGIAGWRRYGTQKLDEAEVTGLLKSLEIRGRDATGLCWRGAKQDWVLKTPAKATDFVEMEEYKRCMPEILESPFGLLHTRQSTHGNPSNNKNNHPIYNSKGLIIHNGIVSTKEDLPGAKGETDTEQILLHIQALGWKGLEKMSGSLTFAYLDYNKKGFFLFTNGTMNLVWGYDFQRKIFVFASTENIVKGGLTPPRVLGRIPTIGLYDVPKNKVYYVGSKKISLVAKLEVPQWSGATYYAACGYTPATKYTPGTPTTKYTPVITPAVNRYKFPDTSTSGTVTTETMGVNSIEDVNEIIEREAKLREAEIGEAVGWVNEVEPECCVC